MKQEDFFPYEDILNMPHHRSERRAAMPMADRAAQFSPFAALTGYEAIIEETGRITDERTELTEGEKARLNEKLQQIADGIAAQPKITATVFRPDSYKSGGAYVKITGHLKKIDTEERGLLLTDGTWIPVDDIYDMDADFRA